MEKIDQEIIQLVKELAKTDPVALNAFMVTARGVSQGLSFHEAQAAGNKVLEEFGRKPLPFSD